MTGGGSSDGTSAPWRLTACSPNTPTSSVSCPIPALHGDTGNARRVGRRFAQLAPIVATYRKLEAARGDLEAARELATEDASFAAEVPELEARVAELDDAPDRPARPPRPARRRRHRARGEIR